MTEVRNVQSQEIAQESTSSYWHQKPLVKQVSRLFIEKQAQKKVDVDAEHRAKFERHFGELFGHAFEIINKPVPTRYRATGLLHAVF